MPGFLAPHPLRQRGPLTNQSQDFLLWNRSGVAFLAAVCYYASKSVRLPWPLRLVSLRHILMGSSSF